MFVDEANIHVKAGDGVSQRQVNAGTNVRGHEGAQRDVFPSVPSCLFASVPSR